ncbi:MAG: HNH endonuclease domain-containing protein [Flavobacteriales bacterium]
MKTFLIKRNPDFTTHGVLVKRNVVNKEFTESRINGFPYSNKLNIGDKILVSETSYGIYACGSVTKVDEIIEFKSVNEILNYTEKNKIRDVKYWYNLVLRFKQKKESDSNSVLRFQQYFIEQKLLNRTIPFFEEIKSLKKIQNSIYEIKDLETLKSIDSFIIKPKSIRLEKFDSKIPNSLRMDLYSLFNQKYNISTWIDIDHFIPKSVGGPGNIAENLVPVGFSLNRYKSNAIPKGLFYHANKNKELKKYVKKEYLKENTPNYISKKDFKSSNEDARKIIDLVKKMSYNDSILFFKNVMGYHHPKYIKLIEEFKGKS